VRTVPAGDIEASVVALVRKGLTTPEVAARTYHEARGLGADAVDEAEITAHLRQFNELVDLRWQQWVLGYQQQQQFKLLESLGVANPDWTALGRVIAATIARRRRRRTPCASP
jgi:hypothetical protein